MSRYEGVSQPQNRYIFRFIHEQNAEGWTVRDTLLGRTAGRYDCENDAVLAALKAMSKASEYRGDQRPDLVIPLA